ncbi:hypothetical protein, partial [Streptomyces noursei]
IPGRRNGEEETMTTPDARTRTRLQELEDRLGERTPPPLDGQTRIPLPPPATPDGEDDDSGTP